jgi:hypothetical protein
MPSPQEQFAEEWLRSYLSMRFSISPTRIDRQQKLKQWGVSDPSHFAALIGAFNIYCSSKVEWRDVEIIPPDTDRGSEDDRHAHIGARS